MAAQLQHGLSSRNAVKRNSSLELEEVRICSYMFWIAQEPPCLIRCELHGQYQGQSQSTYSLKSLHSSQACSKAVSYASWHPDLARTHVSMARGIHFSSMGHSAPRPVGENGIQKVQKRLELLPEEAIYLIERGSLFCWKQTDLDVGQVPDLHDINGSPMSVQQAYAEMIGREGLTLEKFQVCSETFFWYGMA
jgi:tRNA-splicing endonuclease subunit sen54 N-term